MRIRGLDLYSLSMTIEGIDDDDNSWKEMIE